MENNTGKRADGAPSIRGVTCHGCRYYKEQWNGEHLVARKCKLYLRSAEERCYDYRKEPRLRQED